MEILAPVGSAEALEAAVRCGADAVYLGLSDFNARKNASNFNDGAFISAVEYCHMRGVKVYLTLNTLISDNELPRALSVAELACKAGADAIIVQDLGLLRLLKSTAPELKLHASTQMSVHTPAALDPLHELGIKRVVLARELSNREIGEIATYANQLGMETEVFVHGALCMSVSGQCYLSGMLGSRSGNRGLCAQPCRLPFQNAAGSEHALSLKDLSLIGHMEELTKLSVTSLKIEGRMKRPEYVAAAVSAFRAAADGQAVDERLLQSLFDVFSRSGHTDGYFTAQRGAAMFGFRTDNDVRASAEINNSLHTLYRVERQKVPVTIHLEAVAGIPCSLTMNDGEHSVTIQGEVPQTAINRPLATEYAREQCEKLGGTVFLPSGFSANISDGLILTAAQLNRLRRDAVEQLSALRVTKPKSYFSPDMALKNEPCAQKPRLFARFSDISQISPDISGVDTVYLPVETDFAANSLVLAQLKEKNITVGAELPRSLFSLDGRCAEWLSNAKQHGISLALCQNLSALSLAKKAGMKIHAGFGMNLYNAHAVQAIRLLGAEYSTLSFELSLTQLKHMASSKSGIIGYGQLPLMLCRNCPAKGDGDCAQCAGHGKLTDRKNIDFPVLCRLGTSEVLNSRPLYMADRLRELPELYFISLYFSTESSSECSNIIRAYQNGAAAPEEYTRGLYYRGLL